MGKSVIVPKIASFIVFVAQGCRYAMCLYAECRGADKNS
jgi:hypothetical protein